ncbi:MAG: hypothetical protein HXX18_06695 [Bacteroidetes bacterium]|nr:hypothetical protein [Bacteroidota bacterium]
MKRKFVLFFLFMLQISLYGQKEVVIDTTKTNFPQRKLNGFLSLINDFTLNDNQQFASAGMGVAFLFANKFYIGGYGLGLISVLHRSDVLADNKMENYHLNYAHGGLWLGIIDSPCKKNQASISLKIGWGALFMNDVNNTINYNAYRDEFLIITPQFEIGVLITNWLRADLGLGVRFLSGISTFYKDSNGNMSLVYHSSDFEGFISSLRLSFGSFCYK